MTRPKVYTDKVQVALCMERKEKEIFEQRARALNFRSLNDFILSALRDKCAAINTTEELNVKLTKLEAEKKATEHDMATKQAEIEITKASLMAVQTFKAATDPKFERDYADSVEAVRDAIDRGNEVKVAEGRAQYLKGKFKRIVPPEAILQEAYKKDDEKKTGTMFR